MFYNSAVTAVITLRKLYIRIYVENARNSNCSRSTMVVKCLSFTIQLVEYSF